MTEPRDAEEQYGEAIDASAPSRREALERISEQYSVGAYLLSWVILLVWVCMVVLTSPAHAVRWLFHRSRPRGEDAEGFAVEVEEAIGDWGADSDLEPEPIAVPRSAVPGASHLAIPLPVEPLESADADADAIEADDLDMPPDNEPEDWVEFDDPDASGEAEGEPADETPIWYRCPALAFAVVYLQLLVIAELLAIGWSEFGPAAHFALIAVLLLHRWRTSSPVRAGLLLVLTLPSVVRIASLAALEVEIDPVWRPLLVAAAVLATAYLVYRRSGLNRAEAGCARWDLPRQFPIALLGLPLGVIEFAILHSGPLPPDRAIVGVAIASLVLLCGGVAYELVFRGLLQAAAGRTLGAWPAIVLAAAMATVLQLGTSSLPDLVFVLTVGLLFGWLVYRTRSILGVSLAHGLRAIVLLVLAPLGLLPLPSTFPNLAAVPSGVLIRAEVYGADHASSDASIVALIDQR